MNHPQFHSNPNIYSITYYKISLTSIYIIYPHLSLNILLIPISIYSPNSMTSIIFLTYYHYNLYMINSIP